MTDHNPRDRYRRLVEQSGVGLFETEVDGHIAWVNPAAARIVGFDTPEQLMAEVPDIRDLYVHPELRDEFIRATRDTGGVSGFEYEIRRRDGATRWISVSSRPRLDDTGVTSGFEGTVVDVTERKLVEAAAAAIGSDLDPQEAVVAFALVLRRVVPFQQLSLVVIEGDHYRRAVSVSGGAAQPLPPDEKVPLEGNSVGWVVLHREPLVEQSTASGKWPFDATLRAAGVGSYAIFPLVVADEVFGTFNIGMEPPGSFTDEIVKLLAAQVGSASQAVRNILLYERERSAVRHLERLDELKNEFLARVTHDLRTPLAVIASLTALLTDNIEHWTPIERDDALEAIARNVRRLQRSVKHDLDVALIESNEVLFDVRTFDLMSVINRAVDDALTVQKTHVIEVLDQDLLLVEGDEERTQQVLDNLISNATKFSPPGSTIELGAEVRGDTVEVWVSDRGPGVAEAKMPLLFKKLGRIELDVPGTGLGLYICRAFIEGQGGRIWVESRARGGVTFRFTLPAGAESRPGTGIG